MWPTIDLNQCCVVVTGSAGFLGGALVSRLLERGAEVVGVDRESRSPCSGHRHITADLPAGATEVAAAVAALERSRVVVIHLAGLAHAGRCEDNPVLARQLNVDLAGDVARLAVDRGWDRVVLPSTALVYGSHGSGSFAEDAPLDPANVYARTKVEAESLLGDAVTGTGTAAVIARLSNVYGAGGSPDTVIDRVVRQLKAGGSVRLFTLTPVRDFIAVDDVAEGLVRLATVRLDHSPAIVNLSTGEGTSIRGLAEAACAVTGRTEVTIQAEHDREDGPSRLVLDNQRLRKLTGWSPTVGLSAGLATLLEEDD